MGGLDRKRKEEEVTFTHAPCPLGTRLTWARGRTGYTQRVKHHSTCAPGQANHRLCLGLEEQRCPAARSPYSQAKQRGYCSKQKYPVVMPCLQENHSNTKPGGGPASTLSQGAPRSLQEHRVRKAGRARASPQDQTYGTLELLSNNNDSHKQPYQISCTSTFLLQKRKVIKTHLHPHEGAQRDKGVGESPNNTLPQLLPGHHRSHQAIKGSSPQAQRSTGGQTWLHGGDLPLSWDLLEHLSRLLLKAERPFTNGRSLQVLPAAFQEVNTTTNSSSPLEYELVILFLDISFSSNRNPPLTAWMPENHCGTWLWCTGGWAERDTYKQSFPYESQNCIGWKRPLRSSSPTINLTLPSPPLYHVPKHLIQTAFKYLQGWRLNHFPGQPVPVLDNPFSEVKFPNIQSKPPLAQLGAISSCPIACYLGEETDPTSLQPPFRQLDKVSPQPPFLQAKQSQLPQPLPISLVLQTLHQLRCPSLDSHQPLNVSLVVGGPKLNTVFEVRPRQCRVQGHDHFPSPAGHAIADTSQDAVGLLGPLGTLLAHVQPAVNQHPQVLFCLAAFQPLFPKPVALHGVAVAQVQDLALGLVKPHTTDLGPSIQPVQVPLQSLPTLQQINTPAQLGVICKLTEGALNPFVQILHKDIKQTWPQHRALGNTACDQPPTGVNSIHHHSLGQATQPVLYPAKSTPVQAMSSQFLQENAVGNCVKGFTEV
ncbi:LOW QUALITY PROTEIN: hypothetical protein QYF61_013116 [Mycteria americana]|uniref:Uncharacterized protein n=1 Tax=Mycteria americana TaxID=33587 RepID=A0AAN7RYA2_MYCAM|nr:LOW QUALITY PROTEIN: hypothetical protein QYF61_013116 [Mycteria americana]